ncbi:MAG: hypothetical protein J7501_08210, partial [Bdellovibrio sp.]|nr:hypothetical protein [Bdellovibrio sp.]
MKNSVVVCFSLLLLSACSINLGNAEGSTDLGSLSGDFTYHDLYQGVNSNSQSFTFYQKIQLRTSDSGFVFD